MELIHLSLSDLQKAVEPRYKTTQEQNLVVLWLLEAITKKPRASFFGHKKIALTPEQKKLLDTYLYEHVTLHKPLQYILGSVPFAHLEIIVEPPTLIPRPETEEWVMMLIESLTSLEQKNLHILDMCTGSGAIALALAKALPQAQVLGVDFAPKAVALAQKNAEHNHIKNCTFVLSDLFQALPEKKLFDLIVTNPPYISDEEFAALEPTITQWEDPLALRAAEQGLHLIKKIITQAPHYLKNNIALERHHMSQLYCEIGYKQADAVIALLKNDGYHDIHILKDLSGNDRVACARWH